MASTNLVDKEESTPKVGNLSSFRPFDKKLSGETQPGSTISERNQRPAQNGAIDADTLYLGVAYEGPAVPVRRVPVRRVTFEIDLRDLLHDLPGSQRRLPRPRLRSPTVERNHQVGSIVTTIKKKNKKKKK